MPTNNAINSNIPIEIGKGGTGSTTGAFTSINFVSITSTSTYTPPSNLLYAIVECVGGGGGSAGSGNVTPGTNIGLISPGSGAGYTKKTYARSALLPNVSVTIGAAGTAGAAGANNGGNGGDTTFLGMTAGGGLGGLTVTPQTIPNSFEQPGGTATGGDINIPGATTGVFSYEASGFGSTLSVFPSGYSVFSSPVMKTAGNGYGGGGGSNYFLGAGTHAGFAGSPGVVFITEFLA